MSEVVTHQMQRAAVNGVELEYELRGSGEPVVLIHWGVCAAWAEPLMDEPALADRHRLLGYHRAGFAGSDRIEGPLSMADHAAHCALLMRHLGIERAHVVGHSSSADIALQLALDFPDSVHTLALLEPARPVPPTDEQAVADAGAFFARELPALQQWSFTQADASRITQPTLAVLGENTAPTFPERLQLLISWLPNVEAVELPDATHLLHLQNPRGMADALASFYARHPLAASTA
jgi:pimeloyl-ACP methyl ester carboxylesterase